MNIIEFILNLFKKPPSITPAIIAQPAAGPQPLTLRPPKQCIDLIAKFEGLRLEPYLDAVGVPTIGYGATYYKDNSLVTMKDPPITEDVAKELLSYHVRNFYQQIKTITKDINLNENQLSALTSFSYNLGIGALLKSTLLKKLRINHLDRTIFDEFLKWNKAGGKELAGLTKRRHEEAELYYA